MEKFEIVKASEEFKTRLDKISLVIKPSELQDNLAKYSQIMSSDNFWTDQKNANHVIKLNKEAGDKLSTYNLLVKDLSDIDAIIELDDESLFQEAEESIVTFNKKLEAFEIELLLDGEFDNTNAIIEIHPGAGGTESQDWALMLYRMYKRYSERNNFTCELIDYQDGNEAGIKSVTFQINGKYAFGYLKSETGVHRLVRISPFDSQARRHTSFAAVTVIPEIDEDIEIEIKDEDIRVDTYHASGAGGQHINKTDSAVRITHLPSGIVVCSQSQRSQIQNRVKALQILKSRLYQKEAEQKAQKIKDVAGELMENGWGSQIRSYILHPYSLVKDHRTLVESTNPANVLDGDIEIFLDGYLQWLKKGK